MSAGAFLKHVAVFGWQFPQLVNVSCRATQCSRQPKRMSCENILRSAPLALLKWNYQHTVKNKGQIYHNGW